MTPYEYVRSRYDFPFELYPFQVDDVNELAPLPKTGNYAECGLGKTPVSTACALYKLLTGTETVLVLMPPILVVQWAAWLSRIKHRDGRALKVLSYQGTPLQRRAMSFEGHDFILMGMTIFKIDIERIESEVGGKRVHVVLDEAQCIKDVGTNNYKTYRDFIETQTHMLLTGTPLNSPLDVYAYVKLVAPSIYRNLNYFLNMHVAEKDPFGNPTAFANEDLLASNLLINAVRRTKEGVLKDLPECIITNIEYGLDKRHMALYKKLVDEHLLKLPDGDKIDATQVMALRHALSQIIMQWHYFGQNPSLKSAGYDVIDEVISELGGKKLIIFGTYVRSNEELVRRYNCPGIWGGVTPKQKQINWDKFLHDPECNVIVLHPISAGVGLDGAQHCCQDIIYAEPPIAVSHLVQSLSRIHREGQRKVVTVRILAAVGTIQQYQIKSLSAKEDLVQPLQGSKAVLRAALFGDVIEGESCRVAA